MSRLGTGLPGRPARVLFETPTAVDDVLVETDVGIVYVQAKRTISLSTKPDSELASVADQFVRQYRDGALEGGVRRDLDPARDRLLLAVSPDTVGTVSRNLREALDRNRTGAATAVPAHLTSALQIFGDHLDREWKATTGSELSAAERQKILRLCSVAKLVTLGSPATVHHLIELVGKLVEANPELCFEIFSEAMLRTTGVAKYEHESMGATRFVELVGRYLADYRYLFDDDDRRARLIECIAIFVEAGWPEARRLFQRLPELLS